MVDIRFKSMSNKKKLCSYWNGWKATVFTHAQSEAYIPKNFQVKPTTQDPSKYNLLLMKEIVVEDISDYEQHLAPSTQECRKSTHTHTHSKVKKKWNRPNNFLFFLLLMTQCQCRSLFNFSFIGSVTVAVALHSQFHFRRTFAKRYHEFIHIRLRG